MNTIMIKMRMKDTQRLLDRATDADAIALLKKDLEIWKRHLRDVEFHEREERLGFRSMERNA